MMNASPTASGRVERQQVPVQQVVDVDRVVERRARAHDRVAAARDRAEELQQARLARAVDRARAGPRPPAARGGARSASASVSASAFVCLVDVARARAAPSRRRAGCRRRRARRPSRCGRTAARPARAAASSRRSVPADVDVAVVRVGMAGGAVDGGHVHDGVARPPPARRVRAASTQVALDQPPARRASGAVRPPRAPQAGRAPPPRRPGASSARQQAPAGVAGGAGQRDPHADGPRSANSAR